MEAASGARRSLVVVTTFGGTALFLGLAALGWGSVAGLVAHPARAAFLALTLLLTLVGLASPVNFSSGEREDVRDRWIFLPSAAGMLLLFWLVPYLDRRDFAPLDGDAARYLGLGLFAVGGVLRIWPMFVLGKRFIGLVAIQPGHELVTRGPYRYVRHPSYLGMMVGLAGWALVFRSVVRTWQRSRSGCSYSPRASRQRTRCSPRSSARLMRCTAAAPGGSCPGSTDASV